MKKLLTAVILLVSLNLLFVSCDESIIDTVTNEVQSTTEEAKHIHTKEIIPAVAATCTEEGLTEGVRCSDCQELLTEQEVVSALGHNYADNACTACGHKATKGLEFSIINSGTAYEVSGIGTATDTDIYIQENYKGLPVTSIGYEAFYYCENLKSIKVPSGVTSIGNGAFYYCSRLERIELPDGLTSIGINAFSHCGKLKSINLPNSVTSIGNFAFEYCTGLTSITIPSGMTRVVDGAFDNCTSLTRVDIPNGVSAIGVSAFSGCSALKSITLPSSVTDIGYYAFSHCGSLESIEFSGNVKSLGEYAVNSCGSLESIKFGGTKAEWNAIAKGHGWNFSTGQYTVYCNDGNISK